MKTCERCPREVSDGEKLCRYHRAEKQAKRAENVGKGLTAAKVVGGLVTAALTIWNTLRDQRSPKV